MAVSTYTKSGTKATTPVSLDKSIFGVEIKNHQLLKDAYLAHLANGRPNLAITKKRGEVRGGGQKPWRQKGTGRARVGSSRNPVWRGGGVAFGPTGNENYSRKLSLKGRRQALRQALTLTAKEDRVAIIDDWVSDGKTKTIVALLKKLGADKKTLLVVKTLDDKSLVSSRNIANLVAVPAKNLSAYQVMNADKVIISKPALEELADRLKGSNHG